MKPTLDEQDITVYASDAQTIQEPFGSDYSQGVAVGKTIPAKWWNWLFRAATTRLHQAFSDLTNIFVELKNLVLTAGLTPDATDSTQITQAVVAKADTQINTYVNAIKLRSFRFWRATANINISELQNSDAEMFEYENGVIVRGNDAARGRFIDGQYSLDGGESWFNLHNRLPYCYLNGKYVFVVFRTSDTLSIFEEDTIDGYSSSHTPVASIQITTAAVSCNEFSTIIGTELFYMTQYGELIKYDAAQKTLINTGVTASSLGLELFNYMPYVERVIEPLQVADKFFVGNLVYDGNTWQNACPNAGDITNTPLLIRANKTALGTKVYFTAVPYAHNYSTCRVPVYDYVSGVATLLPYYTSYNSVNDVLVCYKDYEHSDKTILFSYDCENFTEVPLKYEGKSLADKWHIAQLAEGYLIMCEFGLSDPNRPTYLVYIQGNLSDDVSKYEVRSTISTQYADVAHHILVRAFEHGDGNIAFIVPTLADSFLGLHSYCVYDKGSHIEEVDMDTQNIGLSPDHFIPIVAQRKTWLMPAVKSQPLSVFLNTQFTRYTAFLVTKAAVNTVVQNTLYLR